MANWDKWKDQPKVEKFAEPMPLTVEQLIALLRQFDPHLPVEVEGCDCTDAAWGVSQGDDNGADSDAVFIRRKRGVLDGHNGTKRPPEATT